MTELPTLETVSLEGWTHEEVAEAMNACFVNYVIPAVIGPAAIAWKENGEQMQPHLGRVVKIEGKVAALVLINKRGERCRIGALAIVPEHRGQKIGWQLMQQVIGEAKERGEREMVLEVIQQNPPAVALYQKLGFDIVNKLPGLQVDTLHGTELAGIEKITIPDLVDATSGRAKEFPWEGGPDSLAKLGDPFQAFRFGRAMLLVRNPEEGPVLIRAIVHDRSPEAQADAKALLLGLAHEFGPKSWRLPPVFPEPLCLPWLADLGFVEGPISQFGMRLDLTA